MGIEPLSEFADLFFKDPFPNISRNKLADKLIDLIERKGLKDGKANSFQWSVLNKIYAVFEKRNKDLIQIDEEGYTGILINKAKSLGYDTIGILDGRVVYAAPKGNFNRCEERINEICEEAERRGKFFYCFSIKIDVIEESSVS